MQVLLPSVLDMTSRKHEMLRSILLVCDVAPHLRRSVMSTALLQKPKNYIKFLLWAGGCSCKSKCACPVVHFPFPVSLFFIPSLWKTLMEKFMTAEVKILRSHSSVAENSSHRGCAAVSQGLWLTVFGRITVPSSLGSGSPRRVDNPEDGDTVIHWNIGHHSHADATSDPRRLESSVHPSTAGVQDACPALGLICGPHLLAYLCTHWSRVLLEKLTGL